MKRFITFGSIDQFRTIIKNVQHTAQYVRYDEVEDIQIMDRAAKMPKLKVTASEKIHGTNAAVCFSNKDDFWVQSRKNIITVDKDNAQCARTIYGDGTKEFPGNKDEWMEIIMGLAEKHNIDLDTHIISVYFEWSGGNIQKKSAVTGLDKRAIIFQHFKVSPLEPVIGNDGAETPESARWLETYALGIGWFNNKEHGIYNIMQYKTWEYEVNFATPLLHQNEFIKLVDEIIEPNSPIGKSMGVDGNVGEGAVFTFTYKEKMHRFKVKGEKHSASPVKTLKPVDNVKEQAKIDMANQVTPGWRLEQMYDEVFDTINGGKGDKKGTGDFIKAVNKDIIKEESDVIADAGLEIKEVLGKVTTISRMFLDAQLDKEAGLS